MYFNEANGCWRCNYLTFNVQLSIEQQRLENFVAKQEIVMIANDSVHADDVYFAGIMFISFFILIIGLLMGFLITT